ncbi:DUF1905 domain-containing protein [Cryptosporangium phraense]|uniref:DUF1905 domain-containing protein n=1 Tax=Cryptosporangium phraense TaxID=2593070 RepID=A0A545AL20_9ACTN|nr:DUF1905 domain-containing protein [Cryptosporangium phraense]TQS41960.1 DUF1905 domain-containing protein [Cryptosporangium phraense]
MVITFDAQLWIWDARRDETWTFVSLPEEPSEEIRARFAGLRAGFGAVRVRVRIGLTTWTTSIFPDKGRGAYVLPIKKAVRKAEDLDAGDTAAVTVEVLGF